jgi:hypothetical protein
MLLWTSGTLRTIRFYFINQVIVPGSIYWNMEFGFNKEEVKDDEEGMNTMKNLGKNIAWPLKKMMHNK